MGARPLGGRLPALEGFDVVGDVLPVVILPRLLVISEELGLVVREVMLV